MFLWRGLLWADGGSSPDFLGLCTNCVSFFPYLSALSSVLTLLICFIFSISHPFLGDYVRLRQNPQWKKICTETNDQYVVFADIINKITRTGGKV